MDPSYRPIPAYLIPDSEIVQLYPTSPAFHVFHVDIHISEYYIQSQIYAGPELLNAYQINFRNVPIRVNIVNPHTGVILSAVNPGLQE